ncbi:uncharacterized protein LOC144915478 isoform X3 [Branchiostoma floridae x Branchiostoma belcheri]
MNHRPVNSLLVSAVLVALLAGESAAWRRRRQTCSPVNCQWGPWTSWSSCSHQCGAFGTRTRTRPYSPAASCGGAACSGSNSETEDCNRFCPNGSPYQAGCDCTGTGYTGTCCDVDADECALGTHTCHEHATCTNTPGSYTCACNGGYSGDGYTCSPNDVDECAQGTHTCHAAATCTNTPGSFTCACNSGYTGDGNTCTDINECDEGTDSCDEHATCTNTPGSYTCDCNGGFTGDGFTCTDNDECTLGTDTCHAAATCTNTPGSYTCACNGGYTGDGNTCTDIDECTEGTDTCDEHATCTNTPGSYTCACIGGYTGDGNTCTDNDECTLGTDTCHAAATCTNTPGSFTCACDSGYSGDGSTCTDIDECTEGTDTCDEHATCTNTPGSYTCACDNPYTGDGYSCTVSCSDLYPGLRPAGNFGEFRGQCFWSSSHRNPKLDYASARQACGLYGGTLAMIKDDATQRFLKNHLKGTSGRTQRNYWIGLDDLNSERSFLWNDGSPLGSYRRFRSSAPHRIRDCVVLWRTARLAHWDIKSCDSTMAYICQLAGGS